MKNLNLLPTKIKQNRKNKLLIIISTGYLLALIFLMNTFVTYAEGLINKLKLQSENTEINEMYVESDYISKELNDKLKDKNFTVEFVEGNDTSEYVNSYLIDRIFGCISQKIVIKELIINSVEEVIEFSGSCGEKHEIEIMIDRFIEEFNLSKVDLNSLELVNESYEFNIKISEFIN